MPNRLSTSYLLLIAIFFSPLNCLAGSQPQLSQRKPAEQRVIKNRRPLPAKAFDMLPLTSIKPRGWLRRQLQIQANGLSGHLDEFWPDLGPNSGWLGGTGESWERGPYYIDGLVPLAYLLDDAKLIAKAQKWVNWTLSHQRPDGAIGPLKNTDWWPNIIMLKVLIQYYEATGDPRVIPLMERYFQYQAQHLAARPLHEWARFRWGDEVLSVLWLYNRTGNPQLLDLARALHQQGFDWKQHFTNFQFPAKTSREELGLKGGSSANPDKALSAHGVNNAMAYKYPALWSLLTGDRSDREATYQLFKVLDQYHLLPNGTHSADEHYAGPNPTQGTELCAVVEAMFSLEHLMSILGDPAFGDRLEKITFNALPGTLTGDMWAHQYDQQPNQVVCNLHPREWSSNGPESNIFGLEPNFGCCTSDMHQGWPKFAASLWMASPDDGLAAMSYAPNEVSAIVKGGVRVHITEETEYPFRDKIRLIINPASSVAFPLQLRIPTWVQEASISLNGQAQQGVKAGTFHTLTRRWKKGDRVELTFPLRTRITRWYQNSVAIERGPLVFSLRIGEEWRPIKEGMRRPAISPAADWEVHPTSAWNYGLILNSENPDQSVQVIEKGVMEFPFTPQGAPVELRIKGRRVPEWTLVNGSAGPLPPSPTVSHEPEEMLTLIPYGSAKLRITAFPQVVE